MLPFEVKLISLGARLRGARLKRDDTQAIFSARIGVSVPTLRKMESGDPTVLVGHWAAALDVLDHSGDLDALLSESEDLFAKYDQMKDSPRRRASRRVP
jgi:transcriptional regulator with XRE-family HTH domain